MGSHRPALTGRMPLEPERRAEGGVDASDGDHRPGGGQQRQHVDPGLIEVVEVGPGFLEMPTVTCAARGPQTRFVPGGWCQLLHSHRE